MINKHKYLICIFALVILISNFNYLGADNSSPSITHSTLSNTVQSSENLNFIKKKQESNVIRIEKQFIINPTTINRLDKNEISSSSPPKTRPDFFVETVGDLKLIKSRQEGIVQIDSSKKIEILPVMNNLQYDGNTISKIPESSVKPIKKRIGLRKHPKYMGDINASKVKAWKLDKSGKKTDKISSMKVIKIMENPPPNLIKAVKER